MEYCSLDENYTMFVLLLLCKTYCYVCMNSAKLQTWTYI